MERCHRCGAALSGDETGLNYKLINRNVERLLCLKCLGKALDMSEPALLDMADRFRAAGCSMFPPKKDSK